MKRSREHLGGITGMAAHSECSCHRLRTANRTAVAEWSIVLRCGKSSSPVPRCSLEVRSLKVVYLDAAIHMNAVKRGRHSLKQTT